jgi:hypothetical protein
MVKIKEVTPSETVLTNNEASIEIDIPGQPSDEQSEPPFADALTALEPYADQLGGMMYFLGLIGAAIVIVVILITVLVVSRKRKKAEEETEKSEKEPRKPSPPQSEERVIFTEVS